MRSLNQIAKVAVVIVALSSIFAQAQDLPNSTIPIQTRDVSGGLSVDQVPSEHDLRLQEEWYYEERVYINPRPVCYYETVCNYYGCRQIRLCN